jgi:tRNA U34 5-methylaminomethyl-2-thiouridine-forming methyltransferase MnmC
MRALIAAHGALDPRAEPQHARVRAALEHGAPWLRLHSGDARVQLAALDAHARYDAVFLDPFSPRRQAQSWDPTFVAAIAQRMAPGAWLSTYTVSKPVRRALAAAGLVVSDGPAVGRKRAGTLAWRDVGGGTGRPEAL